MKKCVKITCTVAVSCILLGLLIVLGASLKIGFDYKSLNTVTLETKTYTAEEPFQNIDIESIWSNVYFAFAEDGQCRVECTETARQTCAVSVQNNTLTVKQKDSRLWYENFGFFWGTTDETEMKITVYLPDKNYQKLQINTQSGAAFVDEEFTFNTADIATMSGNIRFLGSANETLTVHSNSGLIRVEKVNVKVLEAGNMSGNIIFSSVQAQEDMTLNSNSGILNLEDVQAKSFSAGTMSGNILFRTVRVQENMTLNSNSGILNLEDVLAKTFSAETMSGNVLFKNSDADKLEIHTGSGSVRGNLLSKKNFDVSTSSGTVDVPYSDSNAGLCSVTTTSGNVSLHTP